MAFQLKHFAYPHPLFGRSKAEKSLEKYKDSVYYLWWEFLKRCSDYEQCCKSGGKGKLRHLYDDFGDVYATDFKTWWQTNSRGSVLFAEEVPPKFEVISDHSAFTKDSQIVYLRVPLMLPKRYLTKQFQEILNKHHQGKRGVRTNKNSTAKYPITGHVDTWALQKCLAVYDARNVLPKKPMWQIALDCKVVSTKSMAINPKTGEPMSGDKLVFANTVNRLLRKAEKIIKGTAEGRFPVLK